MSRIQRGRAVSLVERKKQQWAREREELSELGVRWGSHDVTGIYFEQSFAEPARSRYAAAPPPISGHHHHYYVGDRDDAQSQTSEYRRSSLPPLSQQPQQLPPRHRRMRDVTAISGMAGADNMTTSGYSSSSNGGSGPNTAAATTVLPQMVSSNNSSGSAGSPASLATVGAISGSVGVVVDSHWHHEYHNDDAMSTASTQHGDVIRQKWRNEHRYAPPAPQNTAGAEGGGVGAGVYCSQNDDDEPGWVKRGLERDEELIVSNCSPAESPEQRTVMPGGYCMQPPMRESPPSLILDSHRAESVTSSTHTLNRSYIRGQNVHIEPGELAERERRRQVALEHQDAVRAQLEERDQRRRQERDILRRRELEEEQRIAREQQLSEQRERDEHRRQQEKKAREQQRKDAIKEAIALAEQQAREDKIKMRQQRLDNRNNTSEHVLQIDKLKIDDDATAVADQAIARIDDNNKNTGCLDGSASSSINADQYSKTSYEAILPQIHKNMQSEVLVKAETTNKSDSTHGSNNKVTVKNNLLQELEKKILTPRGLDSSSSLTLLMPSLDDLQSMQLAFLVPAPPAQTTRTTNNRATSAAPSGDSITAEGRLLTPTQYRNNGGARIRNLADAATQTDAELNNHRRATTSSHAPPPPSRISNNTSEDRERLLLLPMTADDRPKWGVNRPPTRYVKQSDKDPTYQQRRRLRQKVRKAYSPATKSNSAGGLHNSSDESGSPRRRSGSRTRSLWRNRNVPLSVFPHRHQRTEIVQLQHYGGHHHCCSGGYCSNCSRCCTSCHCCSCTRREQNCHQHNASAGSGNARTVNILNVENNHDTTHNYIAAGGLDTGCRAVRDYDKNISLPACNNDSSLAQHHHNDADVFEKLHSLHHGLQYQASKFERLASKLDT